MREIKFTVWNKNIRKMFQHEMLVTASTFALCEGMNPKYFLVIPLKEGPVMQFTGLTDKHGTEIYEGDILNYFSNEFEIDVVSEVFFSDGAFSTKESARYDWEPCLYAVCDRAIIVGNIYQNPELLKEGE